MTSKNYTETNSDPLAIIFFLTVFDIYDNIEKIKEELRQNIIITDAVNQHVSLIIDDQQIAIEKFSGNMLNMMADIRDMVAIKKEKKNIKSKMIDIINRSMNKKEG